MFEVFLNSPGAETQRVFFACGLQRSRTRPGQSKSKSEKFGPLHEDKAVAYAMHAAQPRGSYVEVQGTSPVTLSRPYGVSAVARSGPQPHLSAGAAGGSWNKKHRDEDPRSGASRSMSRKTMTVADLHQGNYGHQVDKASIVSAPAHRNGPGGNHYRDRGGRTRDSDVAHTDALGRRSDRSEGNHKSDLSKRDSSYKHDQPYTIANDGPYRRDVPAVDSLHRDSKVPIVVTSLKPTITYV